MVKSAQNCINIHSNCIIMQFWVGWLLMGSGALVVGRYAKLKPKKMESHPDNCNFAPWWLLLCTPKDVTLHHDGCYFALRKMQLCILMVASLHCFLCWTFWKPNLQHFSSSYWMSYILPQRILHSLWKPTTFLTRIHFILYQNTLHSRKEWSVFSYWE